MFLKSDDSQAYSKVHKQVSNKTLKIVFTETCENQQNLHNQV